MRTSSKKNRDLAEEFYSDKSRIIFSSSFRRLMQKTQVFSLEENNSVRNRLTHSLEVADVGRFLARKVGTLLLSKSNIEITQEDIECMQAIVGNACLMHDIGNPPFGHFGEQAIKEWFTMHFPKDLQEELPLELSKNNKNDDYLFQLKNFDGNPQGFRIATKLHTEEGLGAIGRNSWNLTASTLLATIKYPTCREISDDGIRYKKIGFFKSEEEIYKKLCKMTGHNEGKHYFLKYLMEFADDICYCLSDIADALEIRLIDKRHLIDLLKVELKREGVNQNVIDNLLPKEEIFNFQRQVAINISNESVEQAAEYFCDHIDDFISGKANELIKEIDAGKILKGVKSFVRKHIYTSPEVQQIEIAGHKIVHGLLDHYSCLLNITRKDFEFFYERKYKDGKTEMKGLDFEWRVFNQLSKRMLDCYCEEVSSMNVDSKLYEKYARCQLIIDYISGMADQSALTFYQNVSGIRLDNIR